MSMRAVPNDSQHSSVSTTKFGQAAEHAPGLQDVLRAEKGPLNIASEINNRHPLESRIQNWEKTQHDTKLESYRKIFGAGVPIQRTMELEMIDATDFKPAVLGGVDSLHKDILLNKDSSIDWEDVYRGGIEADGRAKDFHSEIEHKLGL